MMDVRVYKKKKTLTVGLTERTLSGALSILDEVSSRTVYKEDDGDR